MGGHDDFLQSLRHGGADCPSDFALDALHARELERAETESLQRHLAGCADCAERQRERTLGFDTAESPDARLLLARIRARLEASPPSFTQQLRRWLAPVLIATVTTAAAIAVVATRTHPDAVRWKGGSATLHVFRLQDGHAVEAFSGDRFAPGDRLRFRVDLVQEGRVSIVGVEPSGRLYRAWPMEGDPPLMARGQGLELPGAVALDDAPGPETLYLVHCPVEASDPDCRSTGPSTPPACAHGCTSSAFVLAKTKSAASP